MVKSFIIWMLFFVWLLTLLTAIDLLTISTEFEVISIVSMLLALLMVWIEERGLLKLP